MIADNLNACPVASVLTFNFSLIPGGEQVQKLWKQFMERLRRAAQRLSDYFDRLNRGPTSGSPSTKSPAGGDGSKEEMFTRRIALDRNSSLTGRRIRPEEHGLTPDGQPIRNWDTWFNPVHRNEGPQRTTVPPHIPGPPVVETSTDRRDDREEMVTPGVRDNEIRTDASTGIPSNDSTIISKKRGTGIQVTDV